uniref:Stealth protein n=1 Tax=Megaviridae environmental sample TaxID=1737588 RepID=A0A5J6VJ25_9VIRU|nr:MAG: stealth protein [Megaviridae environmental sample]
MDVVWMWAGETHKYKEQLDKYNLYACKNSYRDNKEIYYSVKSFIQRFHTHKGKLYIVTPNQIPPLGEFMDRITIINQDDIIPKQAIPCFNSMLIECYLHMIPNITETFLYINDDCFITDTITIDDFLRPDPVLRVEKTRIIPKVQRRIERLHYKKTIWRKCTEYNAGIYKQLTGEYPYTLAHAPFVMQVSKMNEIHNILEKQINQMIKRYATRGSRDIIMVMQIRALQSKEYEFDDHIYYSYNGDTIPPIEFSKFLTLNDKCVKDTSLEKYLKVIT